VGVRVDVRSRWWTRVAKCEFVSGYVQFLFDLSAGTQRVASRNIGPGREVSTAFVLFIRHRSAGQRVFNARRSSSGTVFIAAGWGVERTNAATVRRLTNDSNQVFQVSSSLSSAVIFVSGATSSDSIRCQRATDRLEISFCFASPIAPQLSECETL